MKKNIEYILAKHPQIERWHTIVGREKGTEHVLILSPVTLEKSRLTQIVDELNREQISLELFAEHFDEYGF